MRKLTLPFAFFLLFAIACNKDGSSGTNSINYTLDNNSVMVCPDSANVGQMIGGPTCKLYMSRQNRYLNGMPSSITIALDTNCDFTSGSIPYTTSKFFCGITDNGNDKYYHPESDWTYPDGNALDPLNIPKGNLTLQLTYRKGGHIRGTVDGNIYGYQSGNYRLAPLHCDFDVWLTVR